MWNTESAWLEIALVSMLYVLGHIFLGHFEERTPAWRKLLKYIATLAIVLGLSATIGRGVALGFLGAMLLPVIYIHAVVLPRKGINGWTGEPKTRYYDFRGWDKDIFREQSP